MAVRTEYLNNISLCTGGGGLDLGVELAIPSARSVCLLEREAFAVSQLVSAMEGDLLAPAPVWSDVTTFNGREWRGLVDGVIGGIPCQPHSLAGKREGEDDERDLWSDARRIIVQSGAWWCLIENVRGMLSAKPGLDPGALRVRRDLQRLGFRVEGGLFTAAEVGASHERERVFILGVAEWAAVGQANCNGINGDRRGYVWQGRRGEPSNRRPKVSGVGQADSDGERLEGLGPDAGTAGREDARGSTRLCDGADLEYAARHRRGEGGTKSTVRGRGHTAAGPSAAMGDSSIERSGQLSIQQGRQEQASGNIDWASHLFPPGPGSGQDWEAVLASSPELEPAFRRVADGLASRLDIARVDRLRMLGNGVVPLQAAYAIRTLATRLARRGSLGANQLVRLMEFA